MLTQGALPSDVSVRGGTITGAEGVSICGAQAGSSVRLAIYNSTLDGAIYAVTGLATGVAVISTNIVTFVNGALLTDAGTVGVNILKN